MILILSVLAPPVSWPFVSVDIVPVTKKASFPSVPNRSQRWQSFLTPPITTKSAIDRCRIAMNRRRMHLEDSGSWQTGSIENRDFPNFADLPLRLRYHMRPKIQTPFVDRQYPTHRIGFRRTRELQPYFAWNADLCSVRLQPYRLRFERPIPLLEAFTVFDRLE